MRSSSGTPAAGRETVAAAQRTLLVLSSMICVLLTLLVGAPGASAYRTKHVCSAPPRGRAACMAERLIVPAQSTPASSAPMARAAVKQRRSARRRAAINNKKPYPGFLTPERLHTAYYAAERNGGGLDADDRRGRRLQRPDG